MLIGGPPAPPPVAVGVALREYRVTLYRPAVRPGRIKLNLANRGEDVHDIVVTRDGHTLAHTRRLLPGDTAVLRLRLHRTGRIRLFCTVANHAALGMRATLRVRR